MGSARGAVTERENIIPAGPCWQRLLPPQFPRPALLLARARKPPGVTGFLCHCSLLPRSSLKAFFVSQFTNGGDAWGCRESSTDRAGDSPLARVQCSLLGRARNHLSAGAQPWCASGRHTERPRGCRRKRAVEPSSDTQCSLQGQQGMELVPCPRYKSRFMVCSRHGTLAFPKHLPKGPTKPMPWSAQLTCVSGSKQLLVEDEIWNRQNSKLHYSFSPEEFIRVP